MFKGTLIAQITAIIGAVFLAKVYGEEAYGIFGVFVSIVGIASIASTLQLDKCIVISKDRKESVNWFNFLFILIPLIIVLIFTVLFLTSHYFFEEKLSLNIIFLASTGTLIFTFNLVHESFFTFKKEFSTVSNSKIFVTISNVLLQIILYSNFNILGLIIGFLISQFLLLVFYFIKNSNQISIIDFKKIKNDIASNSTIVKFLLPSNIINSLANNLMPVLILTFFGAKEAGVYFFSIKILGTPLFVISSSVSKVYFQKSAELIKENSTELLKITKKIVRLNLLLMFVFLVIINTIGIYFLELYFDGNWNHLRQYTLILSILIFARTTFNPISSLIVVLNKNLESLIFNSYLFIINLSAIYCGYLYSNLTITFLILAIFSGVGYLLLLYYFLNELKKISKDNV